MNDDSDLRATAKRVIDENRYMVIASVGEDGRPWVTPVYFGHEDDYSVFYWMSSPEAEHSRNIARSSDVALTVFDSSVEIGAAEAVYMRATAAEVEDPTEEECAVAFRPRFPGLRSFGPEDVTGDSEFRLYRATVSERWMLIKGRDPVRGTGVDRRVPVDLP